MGCEAGRLPLGPALPGRRRMFGSADPQPTLRWHPAAGFTLAHMSSEGAGGSGAAQGAPGWYPDPWFKGQRRFWDGRSWTAHSFPEDPGPGPQTEPGSNHQLAAAWPPPNVGVPGSGPPPPEWWGPATTGKPEVSARPPDVAPAPTDRRLLWPPRGRTLVAMLVALGFIVGFVGGALLITHRGPAPSTSATPPATTPAAPGPNLVTPPAPPATPADPAASVLSGLVLHQSDVGATETVAPIPGGTRVAGGATLDLCNGTFPSESLRTARLQVAASDAQGSVVLSTEAVLYSTPAAAAQAMSELKSAATGCPASPVVSPVGEPTVTTHFNAAPDGSWPQVATVERVAFDFVSTDVTAQSQHFTAVYLRRGRALMGIYFSQPDGPQAAVEGQTTMAGIVNVFAARMANLAPSAVNGG